MASLPTKEGALTASNILRLPTAAPRKVDNLRYAEQRRAIVEARREIAGQYPCAERGRERYLSMMVRERGTATPNGWLVWEAH